MKAWLGLHHGTGPGEQVSDVVEKAAYSGHHHCRASLADGRVDDGSRVVQSVALLVLGFRRT